MATFSAEENIKLRNEMRDLACEIDGDIHHGECFYEESMFKSFIKNLDRMKEVATKYYESNKQEMEEEENE